MEQVSSLPFSPKASLSLLATRACPQPFQYRCRLVSRARPFPVSAIYWVLVRRLGPLPDPWGLWVVPNEKQRFLDMFYEKYMEKLMAVLLVGAGRGSRRKGGQGWGGGGGARG